MADSDSVTMPLEVEVKPEQKNDHGSEPMAIPSATQPPISPPAPSTSSRTSSPVVGTTTIKPSSTSSPNTSYVPQFSAATQMILKRMRGETGAGLVPALTTASASGTVRLSSPRPTSEGVRQRIISNLSSKSSLSMSARSSPAPSTPSSTTLLLPLSSSARPGSTIVSLSSSSSPLTSGQKRKRGRDDGVASDVSSPAEASDYGEGIKKSALKPASASSTPTTTKSGRHILKPDTYDPAAEDNAKRRNRLDAVRTAEQALCKRCTRMHSPATNQMVFCDGCNDPWHQRCHEPWIDDELVKDPNAEWYCAPCAAKRERMQPKKKVVVEQPRFGSWADKPVAQKRAYLSAIPQADLVSLLLHATELHPDLPIFPVETAPKKSTSTMQHSVSTGTPAEKPLSNGHFSTMATTNSVRKLPASAKKSTMAKARSGPGPLQAKPDAQAQANRSPSGHQMLREDEDSSFTKLWPRPGKGMYSRLPPDMDDDRQLVDNRDYDAFSVIVFNEKGKKIEENGVKV